MSIFEEQVFPGVEYIDTYKLPDSNLWLELFVAADKINPDLAHRLMYLRNTGCKLQENEKFGYVIVPVISKKAWASRELYDQEKQCLIPYREEIIGLLRGLAR